MSYHLYRLRELFSEIYEAGYIIQPDYFDTPCLSLAYFWSQAKHTTSGHYQVYQGLFYRGTITVEMNEAPDGVTISDEGNIPLQDIVHRFVRESPVQGSLRAQADYELDITDHLRDQAVFFPFPFTAYALFKVTEWKDANYAARVGMFAIQVADDSIYHPPFHCLGPEALTYIERVGSETILDLPFNL